MSTTKQKFGVENIITVLDFHFGLAKELASALKDGKFKLFEALGFVDDLMKIDGLIKAVPQLKSEFAELSPEELQEIKAWAQENYEFEGTVDELIDAAFDAITGTHKMITLFTKKK